MISSVTQLPHFGEKVASATLTARAKVRRVWRPCSYHMPMVCAALAARPRVELQVHGRGCWRRNGQRWLGCKKRCDPHAGQCSGHTRRRVTTCACGWQVMDLEGKVEQLTADLKSCASGPRKGASAVCTSRYGLLSLLFAVAVSVVTSRVACSDGRCTSFTGKACAEWAPIPRDGTRVCRVTSSSRPQLTSSRRCSRPVCGVPPRVYAHGISV